MDWALSTAFVGLVAGLFILAMKLVPDAWKKIQREYPATGKPSGREWKFAVAFVGATKHAGIRVVESEMGLYLSFGCFSAFHGQILIPWSALHCEGEEKEEYRDGTLHLSVSTSMTPIELVFFNPVAMSLGKRFPDSTRTGRIGPNAT